MQAYPWSDFLIGVILLGLSPLLLGAYGGHVAAESIVETRKRHVAKGIFWGLAVLGIIDSCIFQYRAIKSDRNHTYEQDTNRVTWSNYHREDLTAIQRLSQSGGATKQNLADAWGKVSSAPVLQKDKAKPEKVAITPAVRKRSLNAEQLARLLHAAEITATATVINDGTVEAGAFAKQLEVGLRMASWTVGGDNIKQGDPDFFPDPLTIEVSSTKASATDESAQDANALIAILAKVHVNATLRFTSLTFPLDFLRIKVAG